MTHDKPFQPIDEQLRILESRGLIIDDYATAQHLLLTYSYYDLINGYKHVFMPNDVFIEKTSLEDIFSFAYLDKSIQALTMKYSLMAEVKFKHHIAYVLAKNIGVQEDEYLNPKFYKKTVNKYISFTQLKAEICRQLDPQKAKQPTRHYLTHHNHVPPWILMKNISLGTAINLFKCLNSKNKIEMANLLLPTQRIHPKDKIEFISTSMEGVRKFRNYAAHNLNFIACRTTYNIPGKTLSQLLSSKKNASTHIDKHALKGIFGIMLTLYVLLDDTLIRTNMLHEFISTLQLSSPRFKSLCERYIIVSDCPPDIIAQLQRLIPH